MNSAFVLEVLTEIPFSMQLLNVVNQLLQDNSTYWEHARMPFFCRDSEVGELERIAENLVACKRYVTAINIIGRSDFEAIISSEVLYDLLILAGTEASIGKETLDNYAVQKIIAWLQDQKSIDLNALSDIEFIYLPVLENDSEVQPQALNTRISLEPDYFCSLLEMHFEKRSKDKKEPALNEGIRNRLNSILLYFKVTPGIDWNGDFHEDKFTQWVNAVKEWSKENDSYEDAMQIVGSGLSYAKLDDMHLHETAIIEELNKAENQELRRGYYLGIVNQRGVHIIDPEGKPEKELVKEFSSRANAAEARGYSRYASVLRDVADYYSKEAERNIALAHDMHEE